MLNHNGALDPQNELQGDKKIIANVYKIHFRKKMYNVIRYRYRIEKLKSIMIYLIELFELHEKNIEIIERNDNKKIY